LKDTLEVLLANGTSNATFHPSEFYYYYPTSPIVVTRNLRKNDKRGNSQEISTVIKFTISSFASSDEATTAHMNEAVGQAKEAYEHIVPSPSAVASASDATPSVNDTFATWEPLLEKIKLCTEIVDKIAEV
jgi:hypothetical protein